MVAGVQVPPRPIFEAILWLLRRGAPWHDLPDRYPPYQARHERFQTWVRAGVVKKLLRALYEDLRSRGVVDCAYRLIVDTEIAASWTPRSALRGHRDRLVVDRQIAGSRARSFGGLSPIQSDRSATPGPPKLRPARPGERLGPGSWIRADRPGETYAAASGDVPFRVEVALTAP